MNNSIFQLIHRPPPCFQDEADPYQTLKQIWMHRAVVRLNGHRLLIGDKGYNHHLLPEALGLAAVSEHEFCRSAALTQLQAGLDRWESAPADLSMDTPLERNLASLAELFQLSKEEVHVLRFVVLLKQDALLETACEYIGVIKPSELNKTLSRLLDIPEPVLKEILGQDGILSRSYLLQIEKCSKAEHLNDKLQFTVGFSARMIESDNAGLGVFSEYFRPAAESVLESEAVIHWDLDRLLTNHPDAALSRKSHGVNILIYGAPGTGKTQYARWACRNVRGSPFEISVQHRSGLPRGGEERLRLYGIAQSSLVTHPRAVLIFDEIEDIFNRRRRTEEEKPASIKGWLTRILEDNAVPAIWISNDVDQIDPALIRRFDLVIEAKVPSQAVRAKMLKDATKDLNVTPSWANLAAQHEHLTPAVIERAARVVCQMAENLNPGSHARAIEGVLNGVLTAQGHRPLPNTAASPIGEFRLEAINADQNLHDIVAHLKQYPTARLCLYGPPGTGKSAFARFVSDKLACPLHVKRASDLLSPFLGLTEQAYARMFQEAHEDKAVLLLDEPDSFLQDRQSARHSWEISEVNEMLTQIEAFDGLFIATTNLIENLDPAAMRRFDLKIHFDYLKPDQAALLLKDTAVRLGLMSEAETICAESLAGSRFTPGDFAVATRESRFRKMASLHDLVLALEREAKHRGSSSRHPGFL